MFASGDLSGVVKMDLVGDSATFSLTWGRPDFRDSSSENVGYETASDVVGFVGDHANIGLKSLQQLANWGPDVWPLVLLGSPGTGKTSLALQSAKRLAVLSGKPELVLKTADFCRRYANAVETNCTDQFRQSVLDSGCLVLDDLQQLKNHVAAQNELSTLLDRCKLLAKPVIATAEEGCFRSDCLSPRLCSRLTAGLCLNVKPPGRDARRVLIHQMATDFGFDLSTDMVDYLASVLAVTCPRIRQFFVRLNTWLLSSGRKEQKYIDRKLIDEFLRPDGDGDGKHSPDSIIRLVAHRFKIKVVDLRSHSRKQSIVLARGVAAYVLRHQFQMSFSRIGDMFGGRDHSTIMHAINRIEKLMNDSHNEIRNVVNEIEQKTRENALLSVIE